MTAEQQVPRPGQCDGFDDALKEPCQRDRGHDGPHDSLGEPDPEEVDKTFEQVVQGDRVETQPESVEKQTSVPLNWGADKPVEFTGNPNLVGRLTEAVDWASKNLVLTQGEMVDYAVGSTGLPDQQNYIRPFLMVTLFIPGLNLGEHIHASVMLDNFFVPQDAVNTMVQDMVGQLVEARAGSAAKIKASVNGLIVDHLGQ